MPALRLRGAGVRDQERGGARRDAQLQGRAARHGGAILRTQVRIAAVPHHYCKRHYNVGRFHQTVYLLNQLSSDLDRCGLAVSVYFILELSPSHLFLRWEALPAKNETEVAFDVTKYLFKYEPIYVARAETPIFDERFIGFGMTRNQTCSK